MATRSRRTFTKDFKLGILAEIAAGATVAQVSRRHNVHPEMVRQWQRQDRKYGDRAFAGQGNMYTDEARIAELERTIGQLTVENRFLKKLNATLKELDRKSDGRR
jgi:transposase